jgi:iron-sulfur cluster assembly accessory protein
MSDHEDGSGAGPIPDAARKRVGFDVVIDGKSVPYLAGATIDFVDDLQGHGFTINNPNAVGSCACGDSFH